jgi:hypothetical protein
MTATFATVAPAQNRPLPQGLSADAPAGTGAEDENATDGWSTKLVLAEKDAPTLELARRLFAGLALSSLYGLAIGARQGGRALVEHAFGVPLGLLLVILVGAPSVFVFLSLCKAPIDARELLALAASGIGNAGLVLAGLAPAALLFVVSSDRPHTAAGTVIVGLFIGGGVALARTMWGILRSATREFTVGSVLGSFVVASGFTVFAVTLAARVWWAVLPVLGGAS